MKIYNRIIISVFMFLLIFCSVSHAGMADWTREDAEREAVEQMKAQEENFKERENKSDNTYLSELRVAGYELTPKFDKDTQNYRIEQEIVSDTIEIEAIPEDDKSKVIGDGEIKLNSGTNNIEIKVTAENGFTRIYNIIVVKSKEEDSPKLKGLSISAIDKNNSYDLALSPDFDSNKYSYEVEIKNAVEKIEIKYEFDNKNASVDITGDNSLPNEENEFVVKVTENNQETIYKIKVYNKYKAENTITHTVQEKDNSGNNNIIIAGIACAGVALIIIIAIFVSRKNKRKTKH